MDSSTPESVAARNTEIDEALNAVLTAAEAYKQISSDNAGATDIETSGKVAKVHGELVTSAVKLVTSVRGPLEAIWGMFHHSSYVGALRALLELGVFDTLPLDGTPMKADELAEKLNCDPILLVRLLRFPALLGPLSEPSPGQYAQTEYSRVFQNPSVRGMTKMSVDEFTAPTSQLALFFKDNGWTNPSSHTNNPYTYAHHTGGKDIWTHIAQFPDRSSALNLAMTGQTAASAWLVEAYPFADELAKFTTTDETVLFVDIGGGKGHIAQQVRDAAKNIKGKVVLQEQQIVVNDIEEPLRDVEAQAHDFFTPQPIKGALMYYIRRCLHDWPDAECIKILKHIAEAMEPGVSRLLISEMVFPESGADMEGIWMDVSMMAIAGVERTKKHFETVLAEAGLRLDKIFHAPGTKYSVIEAYLE